MHSRLLLVGLLPALSSGCHRSSSDPEPAPQPLVLNLGLAAARIYGTGDLRLVAASEEGEGRDLTGDGDTLDRVLHLLDLDGFGLFNTGLAMPPPTPFPRDEVPPPELESSDALAVLVVSEVATGFDANGNGIPDETLTWVFNHRTGALRALPFVHAGVRLGGDLAVFQCVEDSGTVLRVLDGRDDSLVTLPAPGSFPLFVRDNLVVFATSESGAVDLNLDGDALDLAVLQLYDADQRRLVNTAWSTSLVQWAGGTLGFLVLEAHQGGRDIDGDGDANDLAFLVLDPRTGRVRNPGLVGAILVSPIGEAESFLFVASEAVIGDRNGDGDQRDSIFLSYDPATDRLLDSRIAVSPAASVGLVAAAGRWVGLPV
jgi:hypothetical protein